jgi:hypothetical protein
MCLQYVQESQSLNLIMSEEPSTEDRNVQLEPPLVGVGTFLDVLREEVFPS